ncbi:hypothetical protein A6R68_22709 [Neotoma lepida]|uniref:small monomeric GTPase n=1 Tax=Neotoma lepida TaxID=56216 RepID=A0A1A6HYH1_NEOLE|nr:hypothetical protein A6R68_22709 [Neotoma lepida]
MAKAYDHLFKLLLIGDSGVGKTCLIIRFAEDNFNSTYISTIAPTPSVAKAKFPSWRLLASVSLCENFCFRDTAGQERFKTITTAYYRGAMGIILVYDITDEKSFENIQNWMKSIKELAREHGIRFFETSAKSSMNVDEGNNSKPSSPDLKSSDKKNTNKCSLG